jgi:hypothetical protein
MDDLAPAPMQPTSDNGGRIPEETLRRKRKAKKAPQRATSEPAKEETSTVEGESDHQLDVVA